MKVGMRATERLLFAWVVVLVLVVAIFLVGPLVPWPDWLKKDTAAWTGTFGTLLALGIAIGVPQWQRRNERERQRIAHLVKKYTELVKLIWTIEQVTYFLIEHAQEAKKPPPSRAFFEFDDIAYDDLLERLRAASAMEYAGEATCYMLCLTALRKMTEARRMLREPDSTIRDLSTASFQVGSLIQPINDYLDRLAPLKMQIQAELDSLGELPPRMG